MEKDANGNSLSGRSVSWVSASTGIVTVSSGGVVTGVAAGTAYVRATSEGKKDSAAVTVTAATSGSLQPFLSKPFAGEFITGNPMDHSGPREFIDTVGVFIAYWGEQIAAFKSHAGYDFIMPIGTPIFAAASGHVRIAGSDHFSCPILGHDVDQLSVTITHNLPDGSVYETYYAHLSRIDVTAGANVTSGQQIGLSGNTGCTTAPHMHFQLDRLTGTNSGARATVDPYGWTGTTPDPWSQNPAGATSVNLWLAGQAPLVRVGLDTTTFAFNGQPNSGPSKKAIGLSVWSMAGPDDATNPNNEWVEVKIDPTQYTAATYDLTGHYIKDNAGDRFDFPSGTMLSQGQPIRVYSGSGTNSATALYWGQAHGIYSDQGDCAELFFPNANHRELLSDREYDLSLSDW